jgi:alpha-mannosidase
MTTVHLIFNAHLDPIWLWPWQASIDEALATCRSACDRLDAHPDLVFTRGEAWVYDIVERTDPALFERIRGHIARGAWEIVGGWWIQPDCNGPSGWGLARQIDLGKQYFLDRFGFFPRSAYNVDSFGHAAALPGLMRAAGQDSYVMMRPQEHELELPSRVFRWRGYEDGPQVTVFRISRGYCHGVLSPELVTAALEALPEGLGHTMVFAGVGDHGGGPTERQIQWVRDHIDAVEGCHLQFSSVQRFFDAIAADIPSLPLVTGELQHHAIGCYTVHRAVKTGVRRGEHLLRQAEIVDLTADLTAAWRKVCFNQFHDTYGGTCLPTAYVQVADQLGAACAEADERLQIGFRQSLGDLPDDPLQRIVAFNASDAAFDDWVEFEPWLSWRGWPAGTALLNEAGQPAPYQVLHQEAMSGGLTRLLFRLKAPAGGRRVLRIDREAGWSAPPALAAPAIGAGLGVRLELLEDRSDTWSHGIDRYAAEPAAQPYWRAPVTIESGPLLTAVEQAGLIGGSRLRAEWRRYAGAAFTELRLKVQWAETHKLLKLTVPLSGEPTERLDGVMGGSLTRAADGKERPLRDWTVAGGVGVVCPDVFALDGDGQRLRFTLLRAAYLAHHDPQPVDRPLATVSDQGEHLFRFRFYDSGADPAVLEADALALQRPLLLADLTRGMPTRTDV